MEYVLLKVEKLVLPMNFVILDVDEDGEAPLILRRLFLNTSGLSSIGEMGR